MDNWGDIWKEFRKTKINDTTYMFEYYKEFLGNNFKNKKILEIGCGTGVNSILMASLGAKVSVMDYSKGALGVVKVLAGDNDIELIHQDMFKSEFEGEFDIVHSEGVVEHYLMPQRQEILNIHAKAAKENGYVLIIVPNAKNIPYRIGKDVSERMGIWIYGKEYPYSEKELIYRMQKSGLLCEKELGAELLLSLTWAFAPFWIERYTKFLRKGFSSPLRKKIYRLNYANSLANKWGRAIGVLGRKV